MKIKPRYKVIEMYDIRDLEEQVDKFLAADWRLYGELTVYHREHGTIYYQVMVNPPYTLP